MRGVLGRGGRRESEIVILSRKLSWKDDELEYEVDEKNARIIFGEMSIGRQDVLEVRWAGSERWSRPRTFSRRVDPTSNSGQRSFVSVSPHP